MKLEKDFLLVKQLRNIKEDVMMRVDIKKAICYDRMEDALVQRELQLAHGLAQPCFYLSATGVPTFLSRLIISTIGSLILTVCQRKKAAFGHSKWMKLSG